MHKMHIFKSILLAVSLLLTSVVSAEVPLPEINAGSGSCVEPTDVMRKNHMEFILHQRDETTAKGIRTTKHSLKQCVSCHAQKDEKGEYIRIDDPSNKHFCASCHEYAAVNIDCFQCHADTPRETDKHELRVNE